MTSRADDFDVRSDEGGRGRHRGSGGPGGTGNSGGAASGVDYDLGYDDNGWDTQGFRTPPGGYQTQAGNYGPPAVFRDEMYRPEPPGAETLASSPVGTGTLDAPPRRSRHGAPGGPGGPRRPRGPRGPRSPKVKIKGSWWRHWSIRKVIGLFLSLIGLMIVLATVAVVYVYTHTPVPTEELAAATFQPSEVYASDGTLIGQYGTKNHDIVSYNQIPRQVIYSVLSAEDRNFFNEGGISPTGTLRAAYEDVFGGGDLQGGSTITQQFVRNYYQGIGTAQTASRKIKEIFVSMKIAREKSKPWILENYLNTIFLGQNAYGIGAAAQTYFNIPVSKLSTITWSQAALLAAVIQQPSTYPLKQYQPQFEARWQYVRDGLLKMNWITQQQYDQMTFPKFGNYSPPSAGKAVWDPYVMDVVANEAEDVYHLNASDLANGGYKIVTTINPAKEAALYQAVNAEEAAMTAGGMGLQPYMHVGAVLEDPNTSAIQAMYPGPGYAGYKYNGTGKVITQKFCDKIDCENNLAVYSREQVGSSFKPYILSAAVADGMDVQTSKLDGQDDVCIPPETLPGTFPYLPTGTSCSNGGFLMHNDSTAENGAYSPTDAMTYSINTAYADLWHYVGSDRVIQMADQFGVDTDPASQGGSDLSNMKGQSGMALGAASLTVGEQATMLAAIDNGGTFHTIHIIGAISQGSTQYSLKVNQHPVFNGDALVNKNMASQVQSAMSEVTYANGATAQGQGMSDGRPMISKTGTTNNAQSAFFIGAIPQEALAVGIFTYQGNETNCTPAQFQSETPTCETLNGLGGIQQNFGGTWAASIWHAYSQSEFMPLSQQQYQPAVFTGKAWPLAPASLLKPKHKKTDHKKNSGNNGNNGNFPSPTATCPPGVVNVNCNPAPNNGNGTGPGTGTTPSPTPTPGVFGGLDISSPDAAGSATGAVAFGGGLLGLPGTLLWVRRRQRRRRTSQRGRGHG